MLTTGDYRLSRQALYQFDWSRRLSDGLTQARFPSRLVQIIPAWSIHWITNIKDYFYCTGDRATVQDLIPGVRACSTGIGATRTRTGCRRSCRSGTSPTGVVVAARGGAGGPDTGPTCIHAAQYINALDEAALLVRHLGRTAEAETLAGEAEVLRRKAHARFWSESRTRSRPARRAGGQPVRQRLGDRRRPRGRTGARDPAPPFPARREARAGFLLLVAHGFCRAREVRPRRRRAAPPRAMA